MKREQATFYVYVENSTAEQVYNLSVRRCAIDKQTRERKQTASKRCTENAQHETEAMRRLLFSNAVISILRAPSKFSISPLQLEL